MPVVDSAGAAVHYTIDGAGPDLVLVHGFASNARDNWRATRVIDTLVEHGRRVIALDCRGHGESDKPHDPAAYSGDAMDRDVLAVMDDAGAATADIMGYSMGGFITASLIVNHPARFRSAILAGVGNAVVEGGRPRSRGEAVADALAADEIPEDASPTARAFREFAERSDNDLKALAAIQRAERATYDPARLSDVRIPVLVLIGEADTLAGPADRLAAAIPGAQHVTVPGDHLTAVNAAFRRAVVEFLAGLPA